MSRPLDADYQTGFLLPPSVEDWIEANHPARFFREFVDSLDVGSLGMEEPSFLEGRPPYSNRLLLRVWLYGYFQGTFSTRGLERACRNDMGMIWLCGNLRPDHNTLWRFWKNHRSQLKELFKKTVHLAVKLELVGLALQAVDGTKIQAACSGRTGWSKKALKEWLAAVEQRIVEGEAQIERAGEVGDQAKLSAQLENHRQLKQSIEKGLAQMNESGRDYSHPGESEARRIKCEGRNRFAYNAQAVADSQNGIITAAEVCNQESDVGLLTPMIEEAQKNTGRKAELSLADSGYGSGEDIMAAKEAGHQVLAPDQQGKKVHEYHTSRFDYDGQRDVFICPQGKELTFLREVQRPDRGLTRTYRCYHRDCPVRHLCSKDKRGRAIDKYETYEVSREMRRKLADPENRKLFQRRGVIIEPVFAMVKERLRFRRWTFRGLEKVRSQWWLICSVLNLRKIMKRQAKTA